MDGRFDKTASERRSTWAQAHFRQNRRRPPAGVEVVHSPHAAIFRRTRQPVSRVAPASAQDTQPPQRCTGQFFHASSTPNTGKDRANREFALLPCRSTISPEERPLSQIQYCEVSAWMGCDVFEVVNRLNHCLQRPIWPAVLPLLISQTVVENEWFIHRCRFNEETDKDQASSRSPPSQEEREFNDCGGFHKDFSQS